MRGLRSNAQGYAGMSPRLSGPSMPEPEPAKGPGRPGDQGLPGRPGSTRLAGSDQAEGSNGRAFYSFGNRDCRPSVDQVTRPTRRYLATIRRPGQAPGQPGQGQGKALAERRLTRRLHVCHTPLIGYQVSANKGMVSPT